MKSGFLKIISILMIAFGILALVTSFASVSLWVAYGFSKGYLALCIVIAIVEVIGGILGFKWSMNPKNVIKCVGFGVIMIVLQIVAFIVAAKSALPVFGTGNLTSLIGGMILPILYIVAAIVFKKNSK